MFAREDIRAIICARGGYGCNYLLPRLDMEIIRRHPKIFVGYSDATTLLTWFHDATGLVTFHGPMVAKDFALPRGADISFLASQDFRRIGVAVGALPTPLVSGRAEGKLYGGCLSMLAASLGTPYAIQTEGTILLIEDIDTRPYQIDRMLMQLRLAGKLAGVRGIVFGEMPGCAPPASAGYDLGEVLRRCVGDLGIPVALGLNSGHVEQGNLTLAIGVQVSLVVEEKYAALATLERIPRMNKDNPVVFSPFPCYRCNPWFVAPQNPILLLPSPSSLFPAFPFFLSYTPRFSLDSPGPLSACGFPPSPTWLRQFRRRLGLGCPPCPRFALAATRTLTPSG